MEVVSIIVKSGEDIKKTVMDSLVAKGIRKGIIIGGIGSAVDLEVTAPTEHEPPLRTVCVPYKIACEIVGLSGEIMPWEDVDPKLAAVYPGPKGPLFLHMHVAAAQMGGSVFGGGLRGGRAFRQVRVFVLPED